MVANGQVNICICRFVPSLSTLRTALCPCKLLKEKNWERLVFKRKWMAVGKSDHLGARGIPWLEGSCRPRSYLLTVSVAYHLWLTTLFLTVVLLATCFCCLYLPYVYRELLEPASINQSSHSWSSCSTVLGRVLAAELLSHKQTPGGPLVRAGILLLITNEISPRVSLWVSFWWWWSSFSIHYIK